MARTGMNVSVGNTVVGGVPRVDGNSMIVVVGATAVTTGTLAFSLDEPYRLYGTDDLKNFDLDTTNNPEVVKQVTDYFSKAPGSILWMVGTASNATVAANLKAWVQKTVLNGFQYRPRQIGVSVDQTDTANVIEPKDIQTVIGELYAQGFSTCAIIGGQLITGDIATAAATLPDLNLATASMVGTVICTDVQAGRAVVGQALGFMASLSVGTSIGDGSLPPQGQNYYFIDGSVDTTDPDNPVISYINTPCSTLDLNVVNELGDKNYIFLRTRAPKNGLWYNDGATGEASDSLLSTLEATRTIASMVDALRAFFVPYINGRIPAGEDGNIEAGYKQDVLANARLKVVKDFIDAGDISDARITIEAVDGTTSSRKWKVTLSVLGAYTLRWIDGFVFYVTNL